MIRPIDIRINAAHPELPLAEAVTFTGSPSTVLIRGVPPNCGRWAITAVFVAASFPDGSTTTRAAVQSANGVWVATLPATATSGRTVAGFRILADGIDENGAAVTGYVLGFADFAVLSFFPVPAPGETFFYLRYFDTMPTAAKKMDVTTIDGILKYYNGAEWLPFTDLSDYYTAEQVDEAIDKLAAYYITYNAAGAAFPTRADLINAQTYYSGGVVRVPTRNDYAVVLADETHDGAEWRYIYAVADGQTTGQWEAQYPVEGVIAYDNAVTRTSANGVKSSGIWSAIWGALAALPAGFSSLYDWCVAQLAGKEPLFSPASITDTTIKTISAVVKDGPLLKPIEIPASSITVNGKKLSDDVTLTGADIAVSGTDETKINAALADKLDKSGGTVAGEFRVGALFDGNFQVVPESNEGAYIPPTMRFSDGAGVVGIIWRLVDGRVVMDASDALGNTYRIALPSASGTLALKGNIPYSLVTKAISNNAITLDDRADNYVDARTLGSSDSLDIDFPTRSALADGKSRDFVLAVECGANPPTISYAAFVTIMAEDASALTPEEGMNIYAFTEFKTNMFLASRKLVDTVVVNTPESAAQLLLAMQKRGIDTTGITNFGGVEAALGLGDSDTPQDAIDAVMN